MKKYLFVADFGNSEFQAWVEAETKKEARKQFWDFILTDEQRNATQSIECIDIQ